MGKVRPEEGGGRFGSKETNTAFLFSTLCFFFFFLNSEMSFLCFKNFLPEQISF